MLGIDDLQAEKQTLLHRMNVRMESATSQAVVDVERDIGHVGEDAHLANHTVHCLAWEGINVSLEHRFRSGLQRKPIISNVDGLTNAGKSGSQLASSVSK